MKYTLQDFNNIIFDGFDFKLPDETINLISLLALEVGSPSYIKTPIFKKRDSASKIDNIKDKRKKKSKVTEVLNDDDWETLRTFHTTKIDQKEGIDIQIDEIRSHLNKISDKNYQDLKDKIFKVIDTLIEKNISNENMLLVSSSIFEIASTNRFYSKLYADLYCELINKYEMMNMVFENSFNSFLEVFDSIEYVEPEKDYDLFCKINKNNEKRKALSLFFVNLTINGIITKDKLIIVICNLFNQVINFINIENNKNVVDELTENIAILCSNKKNLENSNIKLNNDLTIEKTIQKFAHSKIKTYPSLSNKSIFKYMDMIEM